MSDYSHLSKHHLIHLFNKHLHFTPNEYMIQLRILHAKELLQQTSLPASKIGEMVGIEDENYFYRIFKKRTGLTPQAYRKQSEII